MTKKKNKIASMYQVPGAVNALIKQGVEASKIIDRLWQEVEPDALSIEEVGKEIKRIVKTHPNYKLIQDLKKAQMAMDKSSKDSLIYYFNEEVMRESTIDKSRLMAIYPKFDFASNVYMCDFDYDPYNVRKFFQIEGNWKYNTYVPPFWQEQYFYHGVEIEDCKLPEVYDRFFKHFTDGDELSYNYVLDWLANSLKGKNYCMLTAIGNQGVGKGVLGEIMMHLFGADNYADTQRVTKSNFNAQILNKRFIFVDELKATNEEEENKLKVLINDYIEVEKKGVDAQRHKNYASIYIASNSMDAIKLRGDDRRFSVVTLSDEKLINVFDPDEISSLFKHDNIEALARYLWNRKYDKEKLFHVFITERTEQIRQASLTEWQEYFMDELVDKYKGEIIPCSDLADEIVDALGAKYKISRKALNKFSEIYPDVFAVIRHGSPRKYKVEFFNKENRND